jgi:hypothetical protein
MATRANRAKDDGTRKKRLRVALLTAAVLTVISIALLPAPLIWSSMAWAAFFAYLAVTTLNDRAKNPFLVFAVLIFMTALTESALWIVPEFAGISNFKGSLKGNYYLKDGHEILGYGPYPGLKGDVKKYHFKKLLYDVNYTIGQDGLRIMPEPKADSDACALFFGCSFTFGEGVNDNESMPFVASVLSGARAYNFGFHGYGPHQMLAALQSGLVDRTIKCKPTHGIYQAIIWHVDRAAGLTSWDRYGPKYEIKDDGGVKLAGRFNSKRMAMLKLRVQEAVRIYRIASKVILKLGRKKSDMYLYLEVVDAARRDFLNRYPGATFHVIIWDFDSDEPQYMALEEGLRKRGMELHRVSRILPDFDEYSPKYRIDPKYDVHPNPLAYEIIAKYVAKKILKD